ncbi:MAG: hypothetical protein HN333_08575, partial [Rhodospirillaceae bacterium]|nr:hypothetical protein [Rhodospirillaceae bacterium]
AALGDPRGTAEGALGHQPLASVTAAAAGPQTPLFNLLLDGNHTYWVVQSADAALLQTVSATANASAIAEKAYLVHNKGG